MESSNNAECPTEILVDLNEDDFVPSYLSYKKVHTPAHSEKATACVQNKGNEYILKQEKYQCLMDMSPFRLNSECNEPDINSFANPEQFLGGAEDDCPTALLIDVSNSSRTSSKQISLLRCNKRDSRQEESLVKYSSNQDAKLKEYSCIGKKIHSAIEDSDNPCSVSPVKNELSPPRLRWKTPSPQSMSRISKEASKIIYDLNSSAILDEYSLCEEIMPIPINFNLDENSDEETLITSAETCSGYSLLNEKSSVSIQTEQDVISSGISKIVLNSSSSDIQDACISPKYNSLAQSSLERFDSTVEDKKDSNKRSTTSENLQLSEVQSSSFDSSEVFISDGETSVFIENNLPSEDKENIQERKDKILPSNTIIKGNKATQKNAVSVKEIEKRPTLRNLSNIKNVNSRYLPSINKMNSTLNYNFAPNSKGLQSQGKQQLKKTTSAEPQMPKGISRSNSFQYGSKREFGFSFQQTKSIKPKPSLLSEYKSSSSDVKPSFTEMKTPNKRYSIATPLQSRSIKKSTLTPALPRIQNPSIPRFTPQSASGNRLSFSKSWQQPNKLSSKGFKNQNTMRRSSAEKPSFCGIYSSKQNKQAFNQSISHLPSQMSKERSFSTTSKNRFCGKLNLPSSLPAEQDRKLARALFPSKSFK